MARLLVHVEGQTEESFVNEVLREHLVSRGYHSVDARIVGNARLRGRRGGIRAWASVKKDIVNHLREDRDCIRDDNDRLLRLASIVAGKRAIQEPNSGCGESSVRAAGRMGRSANGNWRSPL